MREAEPMTQTMNVTTVRENWSADFAVLDRIGAAFADVPDEDLEREVTKAVAHARAELRAEREQAARTP